MKFLAKSTQLKLAMVVEKTHTYIVEISKHELIRNGYNMYDKNSS